MAEHLAGNDIGHVVASPLERAQQTAAPITDSHQLTLATDEQLIEADNVFEGKRVAVGDGALRSPRHWPQLRNPFLPSWGEPYVQIARRMLGGGVPGAGARRRGTRRCACPTSCRSGRCAGSSRASGSGTTRAAGSARWRR